jgi:1-phosphofructokinase
MNPCIDRIATIERFNRGGMNRVTDTRDEANGKGINVSVAYKCLGGATKCLGFYYWQGGGALLTKLSNYGIPHELVKVDGALRVNTKIFEQASRVTTELNEPGRPVTEKNLDDLKNTILKNGRVGDVVVLTGSVPHNVPDSVYGEIISMLSGRGVKIALDAEGGLLVNGLKGGEVFIIKPNLYELEKTFGCKIADTDDLLAVSREIALSGVRYVCVSMGKFGAFLDDGARAYIVRPPNISVNSTQGAGDAMLAGVCYALENRYSAADALRMGVAASSAALTQFQTSFCDKDKTEDFFEILRAQEVKEGSPVIIN